jgi:hypothetical protein
VVHDEWLAKAAMRASLALAREGDKQCWAYGLLSCVQFLGVLPANVSLDDDSIFGMLEHKFDIGMILHEVDARLDNILWVNTHDNPRTCPSTGAMRCKYIRWFVTNSVKRGARRTADMSAAVVLLRTSI